MLKQNDSYALKEARHSLRFKPWFYRSFLVNSFVTPSKLLLSFQECKSIPYLNTLIGLLLNSVRKHEAFKNNLEKKWQAFQKQKVQCHFCFSPLPSSRVLLRRSFLHLLLFLPYTDTLGQRILRTRPRALSTGPGKCFSSQPEPGSRSTNCPVLQMKEPGPEAQIHLSFLLHCHRCGEERKKDQKLKIWLTHTSQHWSFSFSASHSWQRIQH